MLLQEPASVGGGGEVSRVCGYRVELVEELHQVLLQLADDLLALQETGSRQKSSESESRREEAAQVHVGSGSRRLHYLTQRL